MKKYFDQVQMSRHSLWMFVILFCVMMGSAPSYAKLKTVKKAVDLTAGGAPDAGDHVEIEVKPLYYFFCDGHPTTIACDENGKTQVYTNEESTGLTDCPVDPKYLVTAEEGEPEIDWSRCIIVGGKECVRPLGASSTDIYTESCTNVNIKMVGGHVLGIRVAGMIDNQGQYIGGAAMEDDGSSSAITYYTQSSVVGTCYVTIDDGTIQTLDLTNSGDTPLKSSLYVKIKKVNYIGPRPIEISKNKTSNIYLSMGPECFFYFNHTRPDKTLADALGGALVPISSIALYAHGSVSMYGGAGGTTFECETFENNATSISANSNKIYVNRCNGYKASNGKPLSNYSFVTVIPHSHVQYITAPATCSSAAQYVSRCSWCGISLTPTITIPGKLSHWNRITSAVSDGCCDDVVTEGRHCERCGLVAVEPKHEKKHTWKTLEYNCSEHSSIYSKARCSGIYKLRICVECGLCEVLSKSDGASHGIKNLNTTVIREATCTVPGLEQIGCTICGLKITQKIPAKHTLVHHEAVPATCTTTGTIEYWSCSVCKKQYKTADAKFSDYFENAVTKTIPATGHQFIKALKGTSTLRKSFNDCTKANLYYYSCVNCREYGQDTWFRGYQYSDYRHSYAIQSITPDATELGVATIGCTRSDCHHKDIRLGFNLSGENSYVRYDNNGTPTEEIYEYQAPLIRYTEDPTCQKKGKGEYEYTLLFAGNTLKTKYNGIVNENPAFHEYDDNGVCACGQSAAFVAKYSEMEPYYDVYYDAEYTPYVPPYLLEDYTEEQLQQHIEGERELYAKMHEIHDMGDFRIQLRRPVFKSRIYANKQSVLSETSVPATAYDAHAFFDYDICDDGILPYGPQIEWHGHSVTFADSKRFNNAQDSKLSEFDYVRTFKNDKWQALYVPFSIPVEKLEAAGLRIARLNDTHQYDDDNDGVIDRTTIESVLVTTGSTKANYPYMIQDTRYNGTPHTVTISLEDAEGVLIKSNQERTIDCSTFDLTFMITGTYQGLSGADMISRGRYAMSNGLFCPAADASAVLNPQRWYLSIMDRETNAIIPYGAFNAAAVRLDVFDEFGQLVNESTAISTLVDAKENSTVYDLNGRRVDIRSGMPAGIYVSNNKKKIVK